MPRRHVLLAAAVAVVWGINFVVIHVGLETFPPLLFAALRFTLVALPAVFFVGRPGVPWRWVVAVGVFMSAGHFGLLFTGMEQGMPAGLASLVLQLQVVFTIALAIAFLGERPSRLQLAGGAVALAGMAIIAAGRAEHVPLVGMLLTVGAAMSWAIGNVCTRVARPPDALALLVWSSLVPPVPLLGLSLAVDGPEEIGSALTAFDAGGLLALAYIVVLSTFFGFGAWTWLLRRHEASAVVPFTLLVPPVGITAAWLALGEVPNAAEALGAVVVLAGLALATSGLGTKKARRGRAFWRSRVRPVATGSPRTP